MEGSLKALKAYLAEHAPKCSPGGVDDWLESLFWEYLDRNYVPTEIIRTQSRKAKAEMKELTKVQVDEVFHCFYFMCGEFQRLAFTAGVQAGAQLTLELMHNDRNNKM